MSNEFIDAAVLSRMLRAYSRRVGYGVLHELPELAQLADDAGHLLDAVARLRGEPWCYSWSHIARSLNISPQAAQQRFGKVGGAARPGGQPSHSDEVF